jgi:hypothetical protein
MTPMQCTIYEQRFMSINPLLLVERRPPTQRVSHPPSTPTTLSSVLGSAGKPSACQARQPPRRARALGQPAFRNSRATRALVDSSCQVQYATIQASRGS